MMLEEILAQMIEKDRGYVFYRSYSQNPRAKTATKRCNEIMASKPELQGVVVAFNLMPVIRWLLNKARHLDEIMDKVYSDDRCAGRLAGVQKMLVSVSGEEPSLFFSRREKYYKNCETLLALIENELEHLKEYPAKGKTYYEILFSLYMSDTSATTVSNYILNKSFENAISLVYEDIGDEIDRILDEIIEDEPCTTAELAYLYHNVDVLIREYARIAWEAGKSDDKALQLLSCKSEEEMLRITHKDQKYEQAYLLVEYIKTIKGAVNLVHQFPGGDDYFSVLTATFKFRPQGYTDQDIADILEMSTYSYITKRKRAYTVLGAILWGHTGNAFITILCDP